MKTDPTMTTSIPTCGYCGHIHGGTCPRVKAIEYHPNGSVKRVEFHAADSSLFGRVFGPSKFGD